MPTLLGDLYFGNQKSLAWNTVPAGAPPTVAPGVFLISASSATTGSYNSIIDVAGYTSVSVDFMSSNAASGTIPTLQANTLNGTALFSVTGSALGANALQSIAIGGLKGVKTCTFAYTIGLGQSVSWSIAEFRGL